MLQLQTVRPAVLRPAHSPWALAGAAWPAVTLPTYVGRPIVPSSPALPDSDALLAAYEGDPVCRITAGALSAIDLYQVGTEGPTEIRVTSDGQTATFHFDAGGLVTTQGCAL